MADLFDRIFSRNPDAELTTSGDQLSVHSLTAALNLVARGIYTAMQARNFMILDVAATSDFNALVVHVTTPPAEIPADLAALAAAVNDINFRLQKLEAYHNLEAAGIATTMGAITTKAAYKTAAGIT